MLAKDDDAEFGRKARELLRGVERARKSNDYGRTLKVLVDLLHESGKYQESSWVWDFTQAYWDLKYGRVDPILAPKKTGSRPPESSQIWGARAHVAAVARIMSGFRDMTRRTSVEWIAQNCPELKHLIEPGADLVKSISSWRDEFKKGRVKNRYGRWVYERSLRQYCAKGHSADSLFYLLQRAVRQALKARKSPEQG